jgi:hypothetical protein
VHYWYDEDGDWRLWASWADAFLAHESDIRQTAQQLGSQLIGTGRLDLSGYLWIENAAPRPIQHDGKAIRRFVAHLPLASRPPVSPRVIDSALFDSDGPTTQLDSRSVESFKASVERHRNAD